jgi:hypothetical protein
MKYVRLSLDKKKGEAEEDNKRRNYDGEEHSRKDSALTQSVIKRDQNFGCSISLEVM